MDKTANARHLRRNKLFGYSVVRFRNTQVLADPDATADDILAVLRSERV